MANGVDLPPEIIRNILAFILSADTSRRNKDHKREKHALSACSLTCVYWATLCRENIFSELTLRSLRDVRTLQAFSEIQLPRVRGILAYLRLVCLEQSLNDRLWFYNAHIILDSLPTSHFVSTHFCFTGPLITQPTCRHPLSRNLPQTLPPILRRCDRLELKDVHFTRFEGIQNLLKDVSLTGLFPVQDFKKVTWDVDADAPPEAPRPFVFPLGPERVITIASKCTDAALLVMKSFTDVERQYKRGSAMSGSYFILNPTDGQNVLELLRAIHLGMSTAEPFQLAVLTLRPSGCNGNHVANPRRGSCHGNLLTALWRMKTSKLPGDNWQRHLSIRFHTRSECSKLRPIGTHVRRIVTVVLGPMELDAAPAWRASPAQAMSGHWAAVFQHISSFSELGALWILFDSYEKLVGYINKQREHLDLDPLRGRLRLVYRFNHTGRPLWKEADFKDLSQVFDIDQASVPDTV